MGEGKTDSRTDGEGAAARLVDARALLQPAIDALSAHIAVLDPDGTILAVNDRWRRFAEQNSLRLAKYALGLNYFTAAHNGAGDPQGGPDPRVLLDGIRAVLAGTQDEFRAVYPCHSPEQRRWFHLRVTPVLLGGVRRVVVAHENVTPLIEATEALRESEARFRNIADTVPVFIYMLQQDGSLEFINKPLRDYHGLSLEQLSGASIVMPLHPDDVVPSTEAFAPAFVNLQPVSVVHRMRRVDGEYRWFLNQAVPRFSPSGEYLGYIGCCIDVHEHRLAERALRESEALNRAVLSSLKELIAVLDGDGRIIAVNDAWTEFARSGGGEQAVAVGVSYAEAMRRASASGSPGARRAEEALRGIDLVLSGARDLFETEYRIRTPAGERWILMTVVPLRGAGAGGSSSGGGAAGARRGAVVVHSDITERREAQQLLQALNERLLRAQEDERRRLAREMHDDVTQRLAVLAIEAGRLEMDLARSQPDAAASKKLRQMTEQLVKLSTDVHAISRQLHPSILDDLGLHEAIESECLAYSDREGIAVTLDLSAAPPAHGAAAGVVPNDVALALYRILQEGLRNVAKHAQTDRVRVSLASEPDALVLRIEDNGVGFDASRSRSGPGLGLASMRERARLIGAELTVTSAPGRGTIVEARAALRKGLSS